MTKNPLVSIVVPAWNEEKNIGRLVESINNQTYKRLETIVIDDGSVDNTAEIASSLGAYVFKRTRHERSVERNFGASKARGAYLLFLDADMELTKDVIKNCLETVQKNDYKLLVIPEKTVGNNFIARIRNFERQMYMGDPNIEVARLFDTKVFKEFGGYDPKLTGPEDYDLPYRISKKYQIGRSYDYILHHEEYNNATLGKLLARKYYYAKKGAVYASKHPELISTQGNLLFRKAYFKNWRKFIREPLLGISFLVTRTLETIWAVIGYINAVGLGGFVKSFLRMFIND